MIYIELSEANHDSLLNIDKITKAVTHRFIALIELLIHLMTLVRGHPMSEVM